MERTEALVLLDELLGRNLQALAVELDVTIKSENGKVNKGWAGHTVERFLGLPINSAQAPNFGSWELKVIPLKRLKKSGILAVKETMAVTMIDPHQVARTSFEDSHLLQKLRKIVIVAREVGNTYEDPSKVRFVKPFDLTGDTYEIVRSDYEIVRQCILDSSRGFDHLTGAMGRLIQPRTKGPGGEGPKTRAFYARTGFLKSLFGLD